MVSDVIVDFFDFAFAAVLLRNFALNLLSKRLSIAQIQRLYKKNLFSKQRVD